MRDLDRFESKGLLGSGGMCRVFRVGRPDSQPDAALKVPLESDPDSMRTFSQSARREYQLTGSSRFPGIVHLLERPNEKAEYLLMELCAGSTLDAVTTPMDIPSCLNLLSAIAVSMEYVRARGVIHGDIKPQNIFLPAGGVADIGNRLFYVKLADFGFGKLDHEPDSNRLGMGTIGYMPPETVSSRKTSHASDLFALGVIAYELVTGRHPFGDKNTDPAETNSRVRECEPAEPRSLRPECDEELSSLILQLLAKDPHMRPESAWEVCKSLASCGATYPFRRAIRPTHFIHSDSEYSEIVSRLLQTDTVTKKRIDSLCLDDTSSLKLILSANVAKNNLIYDSGRFQFTRDVYWPSTLRRCLLSRFSQSDLSRKKLLIRRTLLVTAKPTGCRYSGDLSVEGLPEAFFELLLNLLSPATIKRLSVRMARDEKASHNHESAAWLYLRSGDIESAERAAETASSELVKEHDYSRALSLLREIIDFASIRDRLFEVRRILMAAGDLYKEQGDADTALSYYGRIGELYEDKEHDSLLAETYKDLGDCYRMKRDYERGISSLQESLRVFTELGDELEISHTHNNIGNIYWIVSRYPEAIAAYRKALRIQRRLAAQGDIASTLSNIASINCMRGRLTRALKLFHLALDIQLEVGLAGESARTRNNLGYVYHLQGDAQSAIDQLTESLRINRRIGNKVEILHNLDNLSAGMITAGQLRALVPYLKEGVELSTELGNDSHLGQFQLFMAIVYKRTGKISKAREALSRAESLLERIDNPPLRIACMTQRGSLAMIIGDKDNAVKTLRKARELSETSGDAAGQLDVLLALVQLDDDPSAAKRSEELVESLHLKREKNLLRFNIAARILEQKECDGVPVSLPPVPEGDDDIEIPRMCNIAAEVCIREEQIKEAADLCARAKRVAGRMGLVSEIIVSNYLSGKARIRQGEYEQAFACFREGLEVARTLNSELASSEEQRRFQQTRVMRSLASEIQKLKEILDAQ